MNSMINTALPTIDLATLKQQAMPVADPKTEAAAKGFEAMFVNEMLSHMFDSVDVDPMFGGGHGEEMFRSLMTEEYGKMIANGNGIGISQQIRDMMIQMQSQ